MHMRTRHNIARGIADDRVIFAHRFILGNGTGRQLVSKRDIALYDDILGMQHRSLCDRHTCYNHVIMCIQTDHRALLCCFTHGISPARQVH